MRFEVESFKNFVDEMVPEFERGIFLILTDVENGAARAPRRRRES
jgi:hypothetical protein